MSAPERALATAEISGRSFLSADSQTGLSSYAPLESETAFRRLYDGPTRRVFGWDIDAAVNCWLSDLPRDARLTVCSGGPTVWGRWTLHYIPGRSFSIKPQRRYGHQRATVLYDLAAFFPGQRRHLSSVAAAWGLDVPALVGEGDRARQWEYPDWGVEELAAYLTSRARIVGQLATALLAKLDAHDLSPSRPLGIGSVGSTVLRQAGAKRWVAHYRPDRQPVIDGQPMLDLLFRAYYGGRVETPRVGSIRAPVWRLDLRSAYLWALSWLGPLGFEWEHAQTFTDAIEDRMSLWRVSWEIPEPWMGPLPYRETPTSRLVYPPAGQGWYWWPEVRAALRVWGPERIRVQEGYVSPRSSLRPFLAQAERLYTLRLDLDAQGDPFAGIVKGAGNAAYGKLAQQRAMGGRVGGNYNPGLSGWITSAVRARLVEQIGPQGADNASIAAVMTDGLLSDTEPSAELPTAALGGWKVERFEAADIAEPGFSRLIAADGRIEIAQTRVSDPIDWDWLFDELNAHRIARVDQQLFVPHILADLPGLSDQWARDRCRWRTTRAPIDPFSRLLRHRDTPGLAFGIEWGKSARYFGPYRAGDTTRLSAAYPLPPAWSPVPYDPLHDAAAMALSGAS